MAEEEDRRLSVDKYPGGDQGSLSARPGFTPISEGSYQTSRYPGFVGGSKDKEGNISFEGGSALRGIRSQRVTDKATADAQAEYDALIAEQNKPVPPPSSPYGVVETVEGFGEQLGKVGEGITDTLRPVAEFGTDVYGLVQGGISDVTSAVTGDSVICTELNRQCYMGMDLCKISSKHAETMNKYVVRGYRIWAIPYVRLMRKSRIATILVKDIARCRSEEVAYQTGNRDKGNLIGKLARWIGEPICGLIGLFVCDPDYLALYETQEK